MAYAPKGPTYSWIPSLDTRDPRQRMTLEIVDNKDGGQRPLIRQVTRKPVNLPVTLSSSPCDGCPPIQAPKRVTRNIETLSVTRDELPIASYMRPLWDLNTTPVTGSNSREPRAATSDAIAKERCLSPHNPSCPSQLIGRVHDEAANHHENPVSGSNTRATGLPIRGSPISTKAAPSAAGRAKQTNLNALKAKTTQRRLSQTETQSPRSTQCEKLSSTGTSTAIKSTTRSSPFLPRTRPCSPFLHLTNLDALSSSLRSPPSPTSCPSPATQSLGSAAFDDPEPRSFWDDDDDDEIANERTRLIGGFMSSLHYARRLGRRLSLGGLDRGEKSVGKQSPSLRVRGGPGKLQQAVLCGCVESSVGGKRKV